MRVPWLSVDPHRSMGRAGRLATGMCFRLFTENSFFNDLEETEVSEIQRANVSSVLLTLLMLGIGRFFAALSF